MIQLSPLLARQDPSSFTNALFDLPCYFVELLLLTRFVLNAIDRTIIININNIH